MDFRVGRGRGGRRRGRPIANAEVMEIMQQVNAKLAMMEHRDVVDGDVSKPENEALDVEEHVVITPELRFLKTVLTSSSKPKL